MLPGTSKSYAASRRHPCCSSGCRRMLDSSPERQRHLRGSGSGRLRTRRGRRPPSSRWPRARGLPPAGSGCSRDGQLLLRPLAALFECRLLGATRPVDRPRHRELRWFSRARLSQHREERLDIQRSSHCRGDPSAGDAISPRLRDDTQGRTRTSDAMTPAHHPATSGHSARLTSA